MNFHDFKLRLHHIIGRRTLSSVSHAVLEEHLTYLSIPKLERLEEALRRTRAAPGDLIEFGVALGGSGIVMAMKSHPKRRYHGFDVFAMIPPPTSQKDDQKSRARYETIKSGNAVGIADGDYYGYRTDLMTDVEVAFAKHGKPVDGDIVQLHRGFFEQTWPQVGIQQIALAHIDCDWYDPVKYCLNACAEKLSLKGLMVIDDYHDYGGCKTAVEEFLNERADFEMESGANPILKRCI